MAKVIKKSVSIRREIIEDLAHYPEASKGFSAIVVEAIVGLMKKWEESRLEKAYNDYYANSRNSEKVLHRGYLKRAKKTWAKSHSVAAA